MRRALLVTLLVVSMLVTVGFTSVEATYWEDMKEIYEWDAMEGVSEIDFKLSTPDMSYQFKIYTDAQSNLNDFSSYSKIEVEDLQEQFNIPVIEMYTYGSDIYINKEAVLKFLSATGIDDVEIEEDYVMLESAQDEIDLDFSNIINDLLELLENMDLGVDFNMEKEGGTYTLTLESDELIDLVEGYFRYFIENIEDLPNSLTQGNEIEITEEEKQEALEEFNHFVNQYKEVAKEFIEGSKFFMESTFGEDKYDENSQLVIETPMGSLDISTTSTTSKVDKIDFELPTSVLKITEEDLEELLMSQFEITEEFGVKELKAIIELDGSYVKFDKNDFSEGQILLKVEDGKTYITAEDANKLFDVQLEGLEDPFHIRELDNYGFNVNWDEVNRVIEIWLEM